MTKSAFQQWGGWGDVGVNFLPKIAPSLLLSLEQPVWGPSSHPQSTISSLSAAPMSDCSAGNWERAQVSGLQGESKTIEKKKVKWVPCSPPPPPPVHPTAGWLRMSMTASSPAGAYSWGGGRPTQVWLGKRSKHLGEIVQWFQPGQTCCSGPCVKTRLGDSKSPQTGTWDGTTVVCQEKGRLRGAAKAVLKLRKG